MICAGVSTACAAGPAPTVTVSTARSDSVFLSEATDHGDAPWYVVAAESKPYARVRVLELVIDAVENALRAVGQEPVAAKAAL